MTALGRRERTKAANRAAILAAALDVFAEDGYEAAGVRDIIRRTDLASGTFYNYFPDKESIFRALVDESTARIRGSLRTARGSARSVEEFVVGAYRAWFGAIAEDSAMFELLRRNAGTIRSLFDEPTVGAGVQELREDLAAGIRSGMLPEHDIEYMAAAMVGAGFEVAVRMLERDPPDVDGAVAFVTRIFLAGLSS